MAMKCSPRKDWHEPDNQGVTAEVLGSSLDNAMGSIAEDGHLEAWTRKADKEGYGEFLVVLQNEEGDKLEVNLAWLLAMASE